jgi:hypothetical protein
MFQSEEDSANGRSALKSAISELPCSDFEFESAQDLHLSLARQFKIVALTDAFFQLGKNENKESWARAS